MNAIHKADKLHNIQAEATALIIEQLQHFELSGESPKWLQPWSEEGCFSWPTNLDGKPYTGINVLVLLAVQEKYGFPNSIWGTYRAFKEKGSQVLKGERSSKIFFYKSLIIEEQDSIGQVIIDDEGNPETSTIPLLKHFSVFNSVQTNLESPPTIIPSEDFRGLSEAIQKAGVDVRHGTDKAYYNKQGDFIRMPNQNQFKSEADYFAALAHEVMHWTGSPERLNRTKGVFYGDFYYALEELIAELGSVFLLAKFGIKPHFQSSVYLNGWIKALEADHKLIFKVAAKAQKASNFILQNQPK